MEITAPLRLEELRAGWAAKAAGQPRMHVDLVVGAKSDLGRARENNEDKFDLLEPDDPGLLQKKGRIYAVADGMGGHSAGQIASELAINTLFRAYYDDPSDDPIVALRRALSTANTVLLDVAQAIPGRAGMGTTVTGGVVREEELIVFHVGDSRLYRLCGDTIEQLTQDHSWVAEQVRLGSMTEEEANLSPFRNVITRSLGATPELEPDFLRVQLKPGERYLFCTDGLNGMLTDEEILRWGSQGSPSVAAWNLVEVANQYGGKDNITVLILAIRDVRPWQPIADGAGVRAGPEQSSNLSPRPHPAPDPLPEAADAGGEAGEPDSAPAGAPADRTRRSVGAFVRGLLGRM